MFNDTCNFEVPSLSHSICDMFGADVAFSPDFGNILEPELCIYKICKALGPKLFIFHGTSNVLEPQTSIFLVKSFGTWALRVSTMESKIGREGGTTRWPLPQPKGDTGRHVLPDTTKKTSETEKRRQRRRTLPWTRWETKWEGKHCAWVKGGRRENQ